MIHAVGGAQALVGLLLIVSGILVWYQCRSVIIVILPALTGVFLIPLFVGVWQMSSNTAGAPLLGPTASLIAVAAVTVVLNSWLLKQSRERGLNKNLLT